jgi:putative copper resistance protein D
MKCSGSVLTRGIAHTLVMRIHVVILFFFLFSHSLVLINKVNAQEPTGLHPTQHLEHQVWDGSSEQKNFSEFNHHLGGLFVLLMGSLSLLEALGKLKGGWAKPLWPLPLLVLGLYFLFFSDRYAWPFGTMSLQDSLANPEVLQHKTFALIMVALGVIELLRQQQILSGVAWIWGFHLIMILPALLLLAHGSIMSTNHHSHEIYGEHVKLGSIAVLAVVGRFFHESKLWQWRYSGFVWPFLVLLLGIQLLFYTE